MAEETELTLEELLWYNRIVAHLYKTRNAWTLAGGCLRRDGKLLFGSCPITSLAGRPEWNAADVDRAAEWLGIGIKAAGNIISASDNCGPSGLANPLRAAMFWAVQKEEVA